MKAYVVDCSIAAKWILDEPGSAAARAFLPQINEEGVAFDHVLVAPSLIVLELNHVLAKRLAVNTASIEQVKNGFLEISSYLEIEPVHETTAISAMQMSHRPLATAPPSDPYNIFDCTYIALAMNLGAHLLTADRRQSEIADKLGVSVLFIGPDADQSG